LNYRHGVFANVIIESWTHFYPIEKDLARNSMFHPVVIRFEALKM